MKLVRNAGDRHEHQIDIIERIFDSQGRWECWSWLTWSLHSTSCRPLRLSAALRRLLPTCWRLLAPAECASTAKLAKLLYLADLRAVEKGLPPGSGVEWRWRHYGPHSLRLAEVERDLSEAGVIEVEESADPFAGYRECTVHLIDAPRVVIDSEIAEILDGVLADYGRRSAGQLRDLTYQTPPMQEVIKQKQRAVRLDLAGGPPLPDLGSGLARLGQAQSHAR